MAGNKVDRTRADVTPRASAPHLAHAGKPATPTPEKLARIFDTSS